MDATEGYLPPETDWEPHAGAPADVHMRETARCPDHVHWMGEGRYETYATNHDLR